ncbi:hypothetical protein LIER_25412 [Lithospermum erythrorhizon]|uniref:Uncharacterized protein n=1 Tax=Lithospermum erythrorhizon TaxID=34254 RepID=A0AAV3R7P4_LITER
MPLLGSILRECPAVHKDNRSNYDSKVDDLLKTLSTNDVLWTPYAKLQLPEASLEQKTFGTYLGPIFCNNHVEKLAQEYMNKVVGEDGTGTSFARTPIPTSTTRDYTCGSSHVNEPSGEGRLFIHERYVVEAGVVSPSAADERG